MSMSLSLGQGITGHSAQIRLMDRFLESPPPSVLLVGPRHLGKRTIAERYVRALLELSAEASLSSHPDFVKLEAEEGKVQVSVEQVRALRERLSMRPSIAKQMVAYIPHADRLNEAGMNALLKVVEEPPAGAAFVFVAEDAGRIPGTIKSRSVVLPFAPVAAKEIEAMLKEQGISADEASRLAAISRGRPGLALVPESDESVERGRKFARAFLSAKNAGSRLEIVEGLHVACEAEEDSHAAWRDALAGAMEIAGTQFEAKASQTSIFGVALITALRHVGGSIQPRLALDAAAVRFEDDPSTVFPSHLPSGLPLIYTVR
jgi:hypothetical protein